MVWSVLPPTLRCKQVATGSLDTTVRLWDVESGELLSVESATDGFVTALCFLPSGELLAAGGSHGVVHSRDTGGKWHPWRGHTKRVTDMVLVRKGQAILTVSTDGTLREWSPETRDVRSFQSTEYAHGIAWHPEGGRFAAAGLDGVVRIWERASGALKQKLELPKGKAAVVAWSPDGKWIFVQDNRGRLFRGSGGGSTLGEVDPTDGGLDLPSWALTLFRLSFAPDGRLLTVDGTVNLSVRDGDGAVVSVLTTASRAKHAIWEPSSECILVLQEREVSLVRLDASIVWSVQLKAAASTLVLHPKGGNALVSVAGGVVMVLDLVDGAEVDRLDNAGATITALAVHPDGSRLATADEAGTVRLWAVDGWRPICTLRGHTAQTMGLVFSPDGRNLLSASWDGTVLLWESNAELSTMIPSRL